MTANKDENRTNFCLQQAQAFVDYSAKFTNLTANYAPKDRLRNTGESNIGGLGEKMGKFGFKSVIKINTLGILFGIKGGMRGQENME